MKDAFQNTTNTTHATCTVHRATRIVGPSVPGAQSGTEIRVFGTGQGRDKSALPVRQLATRDSSRPGNLSAFPHQDWKQPLSLYRFVRSVWQIFARIL